MRHWRGCQAWRKIVNEKENTCKKKATVTMFYHYFFGILVLRVALLLRNNLLDGMEWNYIATLHRHIVAFIKIVAVLDDR